MVLERLTDGAEWHASVFDEGLRDLVLVLCLPLIDGVFATLLVTGALQTFSDVVAVSLTVFSGAGALAVLYSYSGSREEAKGMVYRAAPVLVLGALAVGLVAPIYEQMFYLDRLRYAAGLALVVIALQLSGVELSEKFSIPGILLTGLVLSVRNPSALGFSTVYVLPALATALTAVTVLYAATYATGRDLRLGYIRRGSTVVLLLISLSMFGMELPSELGLTILAASVIASFRA